MKHENFDIFHSLYLIFNNAWYPFFPSLPWISVSTILNIAHLSSTQHLRNQSWNVDKAAWDACRSHWYGPHGHSHVNDGCAPQGTFLDEMRIPPWGGTDRRSSQFQKPSPFFLSPMCFLEERVLLVCRFLWDTWAKFIGQWILISVHWRSPNKLLPKSHCELNHSE